MKVVIYARYSSDKQGENTIEAQTRYCTEFCERNNYTIVGKYVDRATTATKDVEKRYDFQRMIKDSEKHLFEGIVVFKLERFARNRYDSAIYKNRLQKNGVHVISATENITGNKEGIILESVFEGMAEYFSKDLAEKVTSGMREVAMKCQTNGGLTPLGFKLVDKKYVLDPITAPIVKEAFTRYVDGDQIQTICDDFNRRGFKTARGGKFNKNSFHNIFSNDKYIGVYRFQDIIIEGGIPAIIDKDTFEKAKRRINANKKTNTNGSFKAKVDYLLSCKLICGECQATMCGESGTSRSGNSYYYYKCSNQKKHHNCNKTTVKKEDIESEVIQQTLKVLTPEIINQIADMTMKVIEEDKNKNEIIPALKRQLKETENKINNLLIALESYQSPTIIERLKELEENKKSLTIDLETEIRNETIPLTKEMILFYFDKLLSGDMNDIDTQKRLVEMLVEKVVLFNSEDPTKLKYTIYYNLDTPKFP